MEMELHKLLLEKHLKN